MRKVFTVIIAFLIIFAVNGFAKWQFVKNFPDDNFKKPAGSGSHGIAVDPDGKIWMMFYGNTDSLMKPDGGKINTKNVFCWYPDGTPAPWNGMKTFTYQGNPDTLLWSGRGLRADKDGNILWSEFDEVIKFDYKTGACLNKITPTFNTSLCQADADAEGNLYTAHVAPGFAFKVFDKDNNFLINVIDKVPYYGRTVIVAGDGLTAYAPRYSSFPGIYRFTRPDVFSAFGLPDTLFKGMAGTNTCWNPKTGRMWMDAGNLDEAPVNKFPGVNSSYSAMTWYELDLDTQTVLDSIAWVLNKPADLAKASEKPRGIAFSPGGDTAYVACFGDNYYVPIQMFVKQKVKVERMPVDIMPEAIVLHQNYPNPFNPTTYITYDVAVRADVKLSVFNMRGQLIKVLFDGMQIPGSYRADWDATDALGMRVPSGVYLYRLDSNGYSKTMKMTLMK